MKAKKYICKKCGCQDIIQVFEHARQPDESVITEIAELKRLINILKQEKR